MFDRIMNANGRIGYIDFGAGVMIMWVLFYHALWPVYEIDVLHKIPWLFFFMPWFFYKSGALWSDKPLMLILKNDLQKLLIPYAIWSSLGYICYVLQLYVYNGNISCHELFYVPIRNLILIGAVPLDRALWFLPVLMLVHIFASLLFRKVSSLIVGIVCVILLLLVYFSPLNIMDVPRPIYVTIWGLFFFCMGNQLKRYSRNKVVIVASVIVLLLSIIFTNIPVWYDQSDKLSCLEYFGWFPACTAGCIVFDFICRYTIENFILNLFNRLFVWIGQHSMIFYVVHGLVYVVICDWMFHEHISWYGSIWGVFACITICLIVIVPICLMLDIRNNEK